MLWARNFLLIFILFLINPGKLFASHLTFMTNEELKPLGFSIYEKINPNLQIFPFKRVGERLKFFFIFNKEEKSKYNFQLFEKRFNELVYIINNNKTGFFIETVDRYNSAVGIIKLENPQLDKDSKDKISKYLKILERLRDRYHSNSAYWGKIQQAVDTTRSLI